MGTSSLKPWEGLTGEGPSCWPGCPHAAAAHPRYSQGTGAARQLLGWDKAAVASNPGHGRARAATKQRSCLHQIQLRTFPALEQFVCALAALSPITQTCREHSPPRLLACSSCTSTWSRAPALHPGYKRSPRTFPPPLLEPGKIFIKSGSSLYRFCSLYKQQSLFLSPVVLKSSELPLNNDLR